MKLFEYQGKHLFEKYNISIPQGKILEAKSDLSDVVCPCILKAQVLIGGRGKAGGIQTAFSIEDAEHKLSQLLGMSIKGFPVKKVLAEEKVGMSDQILVQWALPGDQHCHRLVGFPPGTACLLP